MSQRAILIEFFRKNIECLEISENDLFKEFNDITEFAFQTPTQYQYFKSIVIKCGFLVPKLPRKKLYSYNWVKIVDSFSELTLDLEKFKKSKEAKK